MPASNIGATLAGSTLRIVGNDLADAATVSIVETTPGFRQIVVQYSNNNAPASQFTFDAAKVKKITFDGKGGNDTFVNNTAIAADVKAGAGDDAITGGGGNDKIDAGDGNDDVTGGEGNDTVKGGRGDDSITGGGGNDKIDAGDGNDDVLGGEGNDDLKGSRGDDTIDGEAGDDKADGGDGNDDILGGVGDDSLRGGNHDDRIDGGVGDDSVDGGSGRDDGDGGVGDDSVKGCEADGPETTFDARIVAGAMEVEAEYETEVEDGGAIKTKFDVEIKRAPPNTLFVVTVDNVVVGQLTTNSLGYASITLFNPAGFPAIVEGSVLKVGDSLVGTFSKRVGEGDDHGGGGGDDGPGHT